jgi:DNA-binding MarR family transcriptional regulator
MMPVAEFEVHVGYWLRFVSNHVSHAFKRKVEGRGVTVAEWVVLRAVFDAGPITPSALATLLGMTRGAVSKLVERLRQKKLLDRRSSSVDRRFQSLTLTAAGRKLVPVLAALADENDREFFGHLGRDVRKGFTDLLRDIVRRHEWKELPVD